MKPMAGQPRTPSRWCRGRTPGLAAACFLAMALGAEARAADRPVWPAASAEADTAAPSETSDFARRIQNAYWRNRTCDTPACRAARPGSLLDVAAFGMAAAGGVFFSRRRHP